MKFHLISSQQSETYSIEWLDITTSQGNLVIQPGHVPIILTLIPDKEMIFRLDTGEEKKIQLTRPAFLEVKRDEATVLLNQET